MSSMVDLRTVQKQIGSWCGTVFPDQTHQDIEAHFQEEAQELHMAVFMPFDDEPAEQAEVGEEIADCIILLLALAEHLGIVASEEVKKKMARNVRSDFALDPSKGYHKRVQT